MGESTAHVPKESLQITVLLASPSDVRAERKAVREAVEEINAVTGEHEGFHLVVKSWETHTRPAAGRPQGVINDQIGPTDIFLGIMWHRLGTATGKAKSGTVEEYDRARRRRMRSRAAVKPSVMFYFRSTLPRRTAAFDPDQFKAVQTFRAKVFRNNLAHEYKTPKEFSSLVRQHLTAEARSIAKRHKSKSRTRRSRTDRSDPTSALQPKSTTADNAGSRRRTSSPKTPPTPKQRSTPKRKPPLRVPKVARKVTDADRIEFAERAYRSVRARFEKTAAAFNREHRHARISIKRDGATAFVAEATANGEHRALALVSVGASDWQGAPSLDYKRGHKSTLYETEPTFQLTTSARVAERDGTMGFIPTVHSWDRHGALDQAKEVAEAFWDLFTRDLN